MSEPIKLHPEKATGVEQLAQEVLSFDKDAEIDRISSRIRELLARKLKRRGLVIAVSGGIDSAVCCALAVRALGAERCFALMLPERDSSSDSLRRGRQLVEHLNVQHEVQDIAPVLESIGCYRWRDEAIRRVFPDYGDGWKNKIAIDGGAQGGINHFKLIVENPAGETFRKTLAIREYLTIVAATNYKQRIRKTIEFFHADRLNYAVVGTPNRVEYDQGFFVKNGDGSADLKPIAHLYKTQVYALARHMGLPEDICSAVPSTDTYSLSQGQDEFYYALPYRQMDIALWCFNEGRSIGELATMLDLDEDRAANIYRDIASKRRTTAVLHWPALLMDAVSGPHTRPEML